MKIKEAFEKSYEKHGKIIGYEIESGSLDDSYSHKITVLHEDIRAEYDVRCMALTNITDLAKDSNESFEIGQYKAKYCDGRYYVLEEIPNSPWKVGVYIHDNAEVRYFRGKSAYRKKGLDTHCGDLKNFTRVGDL